MRRAGCNKDAAKSSTSFSKMLVAWKGHFPGPLSLAHLSAAKSFVARMHKRHDWFSVLVMGSTETRMEVEACAEIDLFDLPNGIIYHIAHALADDKCATGAFRCTCRAARTAVRDAASHLALQHADGAEIAALLAEFAGIGDLTIRRTCDVSNYWNEDYSGD